MHVILPKNNFFKQNNFWVIFLQIFINFKNNFPNTWHIFLFIIFQEYVKMYRFFFVDYMLLLKNDNNFKSWTLNLKFHQIDFWFEFLDIHINEQITICHDCNDFKWKNINIYLIVSIFSTIWHSFWFIGLWLHPLKCCPF